MLHGRGLVIEQDRKFISSLQDQEDQRFPLSFAFNAKQALTLLRHDGAQITVAFVSTSATAANGMDVVKEIRSLRPNIPILFIDHHEEPVLTQAQWESLGCLGLVHRPKSPGDLVKPLIQRLHAQNAWDSIQASGEAKNVELAVEEKDYLSIPLQDFLLTPKSFFNIFIRLSAGKFVKLLNAGDPIEQDFVEKYVEKKVTHLYVKESEQQSYINLCDRLVGEVLERASADVTGKAAHVLHLGENVRKGLYQSGITAERLHFADNFLEHSYQLAKMMRLEDAKIQGLIDTLVGKDHVTTTVMLSGLVAQVVGFESQKAVKMVGMAALFHDIGLYDLLPDLKDEDPSVLLPEQLALWNKHPETGEQMLRAMGGFEEVVYQAVAQHHLRKRGDISGHKASQINLVSEIIGVVDDFQNSVLTDEFRIENLNRFIGEKLPLFSPQISEGFLKVLRPGK